MDRDPRGLAGSWVRFQRHARGEPPPDVGVFVEFLWAVEWAYATPYAQKMVPYPLVHITVQPGREPQVRGVATGHVTRTLDGTDRVVGAAVRPGLFRPFLRGPVSELTDRLVPASAVPGLPGRPAEPVDMASMADWLRGVLPEPDPAGREASAVVAAIAADRTITRVDDLAAGAGSSVRRLQRLFAEHVGVGPKWVIRRYRLHEVTERMAAGERIDWACLATELGYADQAHLSRDFASLFGEPPTAYAARYPDPGPRRS